MSNTTSATGGEGIYNSTDAHNSFPVSWWHLCFLFFLKCLLPSQGNVIVILNIVRFCVCVALSFVFCCTSVFLLFRYFPLIVWFFPLGCIERQHFFFCDVCIFWRQTRNVFFNLIDVFVFLYMLICLEIVTQWWLL